MSTDCSAYGPPDSVALIYELDNTFACRETFGKDLQSEFGPRSSGAWRRYIYDGSIGRAYPESLALRFRRRSIWLKLGLYRARVATAAHPLAVNAHAAISSTCL